MTNVVRHAGPTRASVRLSHEPGMVSIEVTDDGAAGKGLDDSGLVSAGLAEGRRGRPGLAAGTG